MPIPQSDGRIYCTSYHTVIFHIAASLSVHVGYFDVVICVYMELKTVSALMLLVRWHEGHPACKNWVVECWHGYVSGSRCRFAYGPADVTATHYLLLQ